MIVEKDIRAFNFNLVSELAPPLHQGGAPALVRRGRDRRLRGVCICTHTGPDKQMKLAVVVFNSDDSPVFTCCSPDAAFVDLISRRDERAREREGNEEYLMTFAGAAPVYTAPCKRARRLTRASQVRSCPVWGGAHYLQSTEL